MLFVTRRGHTKKRRYARSPELADTRVLATPFGRPFWPTPVIISSTRYL